MIRAKSVAEYIELNSSWNEELILLREIMKMTDLEESLKWGVPTYTWNNKNIIGIAGFKHHIAIWFHQGVFLEDKHTKLFNAQNDKTKGLRQWRFNKLSEIEEQAELIYEYALEAIENQKQGKEIKPQRNKELIIPEEIAEELSRNEPFNKAFNEFTIGKKREFCYFVDGAKRKETRLSRLQKIIPLIFEGRGLNDKYR